MNDSMHKTLDRILRKRSLPRKEAAVSVVSETIIAGGAKWTRLSAPSFWRPTPGDVLIGTFTGFSERKGSFGPYRIVNLIESPSGIAYRCSGTVLLNLLEANMVDAGTQLRIVFKGTQTNVTGNTYKDFEVFTTESALRAQSA